MNLETVLGQQKIVTRIYLKLNGEKVITVQNADMKNVTKEEPDGI